MSIETIGWAKLQTCGDVTTKAVLVELANWSRADGVCQFRAVPDIAKIIEASDRSVQRALKKLELTTKDGGLGLIRRVRRRRDDGGQSSNCFELVGYIYPGDKLSPTPGDNLSPGGDNLSPARCQVVTPPGDMLSPHNINLDLNLKEPPNPLGRGRERAAIPDDWVLPPIAALPDAIGALAAQWPPGAYQAEGAAFHQHWRGRGTKRLDWGASWAARVQAQHGVVMRAVKAGVAFIGTAAGAGVPVDRPPVLAKRREDARSADLHEALRLALGEPVWRAWLAHCALIFEDMGLTVVTPSAFHAAEIEKNHRLAIDKALAAIGVGVEWTRVVAESMQQRRKRA